MEKSSMRTAGLAFLGVTFACWIVTIIGMFTNGSHKWTQPFQILGWIFFIAGFLVLYLLTGREIVRPGFASAAWATGAMTIGLLAASLVIYATSSALEIWYEGLETVAYFVMLASIMSAIWSVGGWTTGPGSTPEG